MGPPSWRTLTVSSCGSLHKKPEFPVQAIEADGAPVSEVPEKSFPTMPRVAPFLVPANTKTKLIYWKEGTLSFSCKTEKVIGGWLDIGI